jgi:haloalkane dehalogenase
VKVTEHHLKINHYEWFYRQVLPVEDSQKSPVILLHGLPSQSFSWCEMMKFLGEYGYKAIAPDWLGWGLSGKPDKRDFAYTPSAYVSALGDLVDALNCQKVSLVIQGFLGTVGIQYALQNPKRIENLVILNAPLTSNQARLPWQIKQCAIPLLGDMVTQDPLLIDRTLEKGSGFVISDRDLAIYRQPIVKSSVAGRTLVTIVKNLQLNKVTPEIEQGLKQWSKPCLIIWGTEDAWLDMAEVENLVKQNKQLKFIPLPEAKHYAQKHFVPEIAPQLVNFLGSYK